MLRSNFSNLSFILPKPVKPRSNLPKRRKPSIKGMLEDESRDIKVKGKLWRKKRLNLEL